MSVSFRDMLVSRIEEVLGSGAAQKFSHQELISELGLGVSRETLRKILQHGHTPSPRTQTTLLDQVAAASRVVASRSSVVRLAQKAEHFYGTTTLIEILDLLGREGASADLRPNPRSSDTSDAILTLIADQTVLLRCLDDASLAGTTSSEEYFRGTLDEMAEVLDALGIDTALLITHTTASVGAKDAGAARRVVIKQYDAFVQRLINLPGIERAYRQRLEQRRILDGYKSLPMVEVSEAGDIPLTDSFNRILSFLDDGGKGSAVASIIGSYGSGKTSLALRIAHRIATRSVENVNSWILPLWINARSIDESTLEKDLMAALLELDPTTKIGPETLRKLIGSGRVWLFVDGLDEATGLRSRNRLDPFIEALMGYAHLNGRLIMTARQEIFDNRGEEIELFQRRVAAAGAAKTLILRTELLTPPLIESILWSKHTPADANRILHDIRTIDALADLARRPIFLQILGSMKPSLDRAPRASVLQLFEDYTRQWTHEEQTRTDRVDMPVAERLHVCELMALYVERYGEPNDGISIREIEAIALERVHPRFPIRNLQAFVMEARVAMFLERNPRGDRFRFSHPSLKSFFVGRLLGWEIATQDDFSTLETILISKRDELLARFTIEKIRDEKEDPSHILREHLQQALEWGEGKSEPRYFAIGPCFSYLIPNLAALLLYTNGAESIDLRGAHLARLDLNDIFGPSVARVRFNDSNLEAAKLAPAVWSNAEASGAIPPNNLHSESDIRNYCDTHGLFRPPKYASADSNDGFVLIPGGIYRVAHYDNRTPPRSAPPPVEVRLRSFLIQRHPVTNGQFLAFLRDHPQFRPEIIRRETANDYYLLGWPNDDDDRLKNDNWLRLPLVHVNWTAASAFAAACGLRLPTEVEWEVACRYGQDRFSSRPWGESIEGYAVFWDGKMDVELLPNVTVDTIPPKFRTWAEKRRLDVPHHMLGLVREWVADRWDDHYPCDAPFAEPFSYLNGGYTFTASKWRLADSPQELRVLRGGSFQMPKDDCTCHYRYPHPPGNVNPDAGFRCVRPISVRRGGE